MSELIEDERGTQQTWTVEEVLVDNKLLLENTEPPPDAPMHRDDKWHRAKRTMTIRVSCESACTVDSIITGEPNEPPRIPAQLHPGDHLDLEVAGFRSQPEKEVRDGKQGRTGGSDDPSQEG